MELKKPYRFSSLLLLAVAAIFVPSLPNFDDGGKYNTADISWIIVATAMVFLMTPGLAFFYGGMVHRKNVISTMIKSVVAAGVVSIIWVTVGYSLAFGDSIGGFIGNPMTHLFFKGVNSGEPWSLAPTIPKTLFSLFQLMFAIITPGLVVGAVAERIRFTSYILFTILFSILVYAPLAHWSWHPDGFLFKWGALDFAGGTVVHISAGCAALAGAMVLKRRKVHIDKEEIPPANVPYVLIGTGLLWFGWFGFNAGSALGANALLFLLSQPPIQLLLLQVYPGCSLMYCVVKNLLYWDSVSVLLLVLLPSHPLLVLLPSRKVYLLVLLLPSFQIWQYTTNQNQNWMIHWMYSPATD